MVEAYASTLHPNSKNHLTELTIHLDTPFRRKESLDHNDCHK